MLQDAKKAGKVWAKLVYYAVSPLLALAAVCTVFCLLYRGTLAGSAAMTASWVAWPLVTVWNQLKAATGWLHPGRAWIHVILLIARKSLQHQPFSWVSHNTRKCTCRVNMTRYSYRVMTVQQPAFTIEDSWQNGYLAIAFRCCMPAAIVPTGCQRTVSSGTTGSTCTWCVVQAYSQNPDGSEFCQVDCCYGAR